MDQPGHPTRGGISQSTADKTLAGAKPRRLQQLPGHNLRACLDKLAAWYFTNSSSTQGAARSTLTTLPSSITASPIEIGGARDFRYALSRSTRQLYLHSGQK